MPSLVDTYIGANYRKTSAGYSNFGTRELAFFKVKRIDTTNWEDPNSIFSQVVALLQTQAELYFVGLPHESEDWGKFVIGVSSQTTSGEDLYEGGSYMAKTLTDLLQDTHISGINNGEVERWGFRGDRFLQDSNGTPADGNQDGGYA